MGLSKNFNRWKALIKVRGKRKELGSFLSEEEAAHCYDRYAVLAWGARCSPPQPTCAELRLCDECNLHLQFDAGFYPSYLNNGLLHPTEYVWTGRSLSKYAQSKIPSQLSSIICWAACRARTNFTALELLGSMPKDASVILDTAEQGRRDREQTGRPLMSGTISQVVAQALGSLPAGVDSSTKEGANGCLPYIKAKFYRVKMLAWLSMCCICGEHALVLSILSMYFASMSQ